MCFRKRNGYRPPDHFNAKIYTGPIPVEREPSMVRGGQTPLQIATTTPQRPNACCFCWSCCCSCSWSEEQRRARRRTKDTRLETTSNCEVCTWHLHSAKPTPEEARQWSQSFDRLMRSPAGRNTFREFLRTEFSEENMLFWLACEDLKQELSTSAIQEKARLIYEDYVSILSPKEVSLDARVREVINRKILEPTPHTFEDAQLQIYTLMHRDSYPRFLNSPIYRSLLRTGSCSSSET
ncbi:regulator of G-protein signaling 19-like isoform X1 [Scleropages formosus]|uniref:regulator of G-protein signaling 19-like isoform X1 n=1 Tax=Scleropages formosus TaxID=113540 RepID=UPI000878E355|nr:regulator of G-protein signaling 19-like isoform X1 [Scleropages formosus]